jgi:hypothetical protein
MLTRCQAFENDKTACTQNARGETKKATSVWYLTEDAAINGVQATTRYRKKDQIKRAPLSGSPDFRRQKSGAKGGRAAKRAARLRRVEQSRHGWGLDTMSDTGTVDSPIHAASFLSDHHVHHDSSPPTPTESLPYTPRSPIVKMEGGVFCESKAAYAYVEPYSEEFQGQDVSFRHYFDGRGNSTWR